MLAYDSANQMIVAVIRAGQVEDKGEPVAGHLETWAFDAGKNTWKQMKPKREPDGHGQAVDCQGKYSVLVGDGYPFARTGSQVHGTDRLAGFCIGYGPPDSALSEYQIPGSDE